MSNKILTLRHMPGERDDRVSRWLKDQGYEITPSNPAHGVPMPEDDSDFAAMVIYGGVQSVNDTSLDYLNLERKVIDRWLQDDRPVLGLCLGGQLIAQVLGATVANHADGLHEVGYVPIESLDRDFMSESMYQYQWHNEGFQIPEGAVKLARGANYDNQAYRYGSNTYGFQFHPEVTADLVRVWNSEVDPVKLDVPGADPQEKQFADADYYDPAVDNWTRGFLKTWTSRFASNLNSTQ